MEDFQSLAVIGYAGMHKRLQRELGDPSDYLCESCGRYAEEWAYNHRDEDELFCELGRPYSLNSENYEAMCRSCHRRSDGGYDLVCKNGHPRKPEDTYVYKGTRHCRPCRNEYMRSYRTPTEKRENHG